MAISNHIEKSWQKLRSEEMLCFVFFFTALFLYVWLVIDPVLIYHTFGKTVRFPAFHTDWAFFENSLLYAGGLVDYVCGFLSQLFYFSWLGAAVITLIALAFFVLTRMLLDLTGNNHFKMAAYLLAIFVVTMYNAYDHQLQTQLVLLVTFSLALLYAKIPRRSGPAKAALFIILFAAQYYISFHGVLLFVLLVVIYEALIADKIISAILYVLFGCAAYFVHTRLYSINFEFIYLQKMTAVTTLRVSLVRSTYCLYLFMPILLAVAALSNKIAGTKRKTKSEKSAENKQNLRFADTKNLLAWSVQLVVILTVAVLSLFYSFDARKKTTLTLGHLSNQQKWQQLLEYVSSMPSNHHSAYSNFDVNRSLFYTGQLPDKMFQFPQRLEALLLSFESQTISPFIFERRIQVLAEIGYPCMAQRLAFELLEIGGQSPTVIQHLALINLIKGHTDTARIFLNALSKDLIYGKQAEKLLKALETDPQNRSDEKLQYLRSVAINEDFVEFEYDADEFFARLLSRNKNNKMAFEYMMALYLLSGQVHKVVANLDMLNELGYDKNNFPRYYEEAIVLFIGSTSKRTDLYGWRPSDNAMKRAKTFDNLYSLKRDKQAARIELKKEFGNDYIYYFVFNIPRARR